MNREKALLLLADYINGHLGGKEKVELEELLHTDDVLKQEYDSMKREVSSLRAVVVDPRESERLQKISTNVMDAVQQWEEKKPWFLQLPWYSFAAAAALVLILIGILLLYPPSPEPFIDVTQDSAEAVVAEAQETYEQPPAEAAVEQAETSPPSIEKKAAQPEADKTAAKPRSIRMSFATNNPKVKIYWTMSSDFDPNVIGE